MIVPVVVVVVVLWNDWLSAAIIAFTIPLIPLFMALVGAATKERMDGQFRTLERLAGHFLDVVAGLPTLKIFGRAKAQATAIGEITERYRSATISTLRITFLSSLILELVATISVALVAVEIGLRLMNGHLDLRTALFALCSRPRPSCHCASSAPTTTRAPRASPPRSRCSPCWRRPRRARGTRTDFPDPALAGLAVEGLRVSYPGRSEPALDGLSLTVNEGEVLALVGSSGCGKSTLLACCSGSSHPSSGLSASAASTWPSSISTPGGHGWRGSPSDRICSKPRSPRTCASVAAAHRPTRSGRRSRRPA